MNAAALGREKDTGPLLCLFERRSIRTRMPIKKFRRGQTEIAGKSRGLVGVDVDDLIVTTPFARVAVIGETAFPRIRSFEELQAIHAIPDR
jgi:hypothetical protein